MNPRGKFISLEGIDGAGKSSQIAWLVEWLRGKGVAVATTREPGGTPLGESLRELLLSRPMHPETELLLVFAARREHLAEFIVPNLERGTWVLCDRFSDASFAYQGSGRGIPDERIAVLESWVQGDIRPDLTLLLDLPPAVGRTRVAVDGAPDRFENENTGFFERVRAGYLERARSSAGRIVVVDATGPPQQVRRRIEEIVLTACF